MENVVPRFVFRPVGVVPKKIAIYCIILLTVSFAHASEYEVLKPEQAFFSQARSISALLTEEVGSRRISNARATRAPLAERLAALGYDPSVIARLRRHFSAFWKQLAKREDYLLAPVILYRGIAAIPDRYDPTYFSIGRHSAVGFGGTYIYTSEDVQEALIYGSRLTPPAGHAYRGLLLQFQVPVYIGFESIGSGSVVRLRPVDVPDERMFIVRMGLIPNDIREGDKLKIEKVKWLDFDQVYDPKLRKIRSFE